MSLNSPIFLFLFLPFFMLLYFLASGRTRLVVGVVGSLLFYAWGSSKDLPLLLGLLLGTVLVIIGISRWHGSKRSLALVWIGLLGNVGLLTAYKLQQDGHYPLGLSYLSFQSIACILEADKRPEEDRLDVLAFSFYFLLFPKIPVGPITRYKQVRDQILSLTIHPLFVADGFRRFVRGLGKKVLIADTLSRVVNPVFALPSPDVLPWIAWLVLISYALQLYFDFSGYVDMAIGLGMMMGLKLPENFDFPYISKNISEFWRRWHITLSSWFRDFIFYPLERKRLRWLGQPVNIMMVFLLTGIWHGFGLTYIIWGALHGLALVFEGSVAGKKLRTLWSPLQHVYALTVILIGWVFFRSSTITFAVEYLKRLVGISGDGLVYGFEAIAPLPMIEPTFMLALIAGIILSLPWMKWVEKISFGKKWVDSLGTRIGVDLILMALLGASMAAISARSFVPGIYGAF